MTPEMQKKRDELAIAERIYEPKYGGKDHSGYDTMMKYEVNDEREVAFENGFNAAYDLMQEKVKVLVDALEFYADIKNWEKIEGHTKWASNLMVEDCSLYNCGGGRAREALKGWE